MKPRNKPVNSEKRGGKRDRIFTFHFSLFAFLCLLSACNPQRFFYYPNRNLYAEPDQFNVKYETVEYPSLNGKKIWALWMPTDQPPKGTVVHFHGNFGNLSNHFPLSLFLIKNGFDVLIFDYQGYGASEGKPSAQKTVEDGIATVRYAQAHLRNPKTGVVIFGQSLGGAVGIVVAAKEKEVKAAVIEAAFARYTSMGKDVLQRSAWTWILSFPMPLFLNRSYAPINYVQDISPRPVFFIHGDQDKTVPVKMSQELYAKAREPKKIWILEGRGHLGSRKVGKEYEEAVVKFFEEALRPTNTPASSSALPYKRSDAVRSPAAAASL